MNALLVLQLVILLAAGCVLALWLRYFPFPSPVIRRLLPPRRRWPEAQIWRWLDKRDFNPGYLRYFYRDPERFPEAEHGFLAPADGILLSKDVRGGVRYVVIALSFWDMHIQRAPLAGRVVSITDAGDEFVDFEGVDFAFLREKNCPVQKRIVLKSDMGLVAVRLITSLAARRIEVWLQEGEHAERGQRIGRILLGSTVVLELDEGISVPCDVGERVWAGQTVIAAAGQHA